MDKLRAKGDIVTVKYSPSDLAALFGQYGGLDLWPHVWG